MSDPRIDRGDDGRNSKDVELVRRALARDADALRTIMQMHNHRLYRIARGLADDDSEAEDIVQEAYVNAFAHFAEFRGESALSTWLCRIVVNEALGRLRRSRRAAAFAKSAARANAEVIQFALDEHSGDAERTVAQRQILSWSNRQPIGCPPPTALFLLPEQSKDSLMTRQRNCSACVPRQCGRGSIALAVSFAKS